MIKRLKLWWQSIRLYVIADPADNSVTLSKHLFAYIKNHAKEGDLARVFVSRITGSDEFAFVVNPDIEQPTQMCDIQINDMFKCVGFETLCPSVGRIFYDYDLPINKPVKLSVSVHEAGNGLIYYKFDKPNGKHIRKHAQS